MKYTNYSVDDFLLDEKFKNWVKNPNEELDFFWNSWVENHPDKLDQLLKAKEIILSLDFDAEVPMPSDQEIEGIKQNVLDATRSTPRHISITRDTRFSFWKIAATVTLILGAVFSILYFTPPISDGPELVKTEALPGQKKKVQLPDGSVVNLNGGSHIIYTAVFTEDVREVELQGEAFFEVVRNEQKPFIVKTGDIHTTVLGTSFNVNAEQSEFVEVAVKSGKVAVENRRISGSKVILTPSQMVKMSSKNASAEKLIIDETEVFGWKDGILIFRDADAPTLKKQLENWYGVELSVSNIDRDLKINGKFDNNSLEYVLKAICFSADLDYEIDGKKAVLKKK